MKTAKITIAEARRSIEALTKLRMLVKLGRISTEAAKEFAQPHVKTWDTYNKSAARKAGVPARSFSFVGFLR